MSVSLDDVILRNDHVLSTDLEGEVVLMHIKSGNYYAFNATASRIWQIIGVATGVADLRDQLTAEYGEPVERIESDLLHILNRFEDAGFIVKPSGTEP